MKYLGIDYGTKRVGLSITDATCIICSPYKTISNKGMDVLACDILNIVEEEKIDAIVLGYPLNMNGSISVRCKEVLELKELIEKQKNITIYLQDERLTSSLIEKMLISNNIRRDKRKEVVDKLAASVILESFISGKKEEL